MGDVVPLPVAAGSSEVDRWRNAAEMAIVDLQNAEVTIRVLKRQVGSLKAELAQQRREDPLFDQAEEVYDYWKMRIAPRSTAFGEDRQKVVIARLREGHTVLTLKQAIEGCRWRKQNDPKYGQYDDLELICRSPRKVRDFVKIYEREAARREREKRLEKMIAYCTMNAELYELHGEAEIRAHAEFMMASVIDG
jgi:hypothetical protein